MIDMALIHSFITKIIVWIDIRLIEFFCRVHRNCGHFYVDFHFFKGVDSLPNHLEHVLFGFGPVDVIKEEYKRDALHHPRKEHPCIHQEPHFSLWKE